MTVLLSKDAHKWLLHWAFEIQAMILGFGASRYTCHLELVENSSDVLLILYIYTLSVVTDLKNKKMFVKNNFCGFGVIQPLGIFIFKITQS